MDNSNKKNTDDPEESNSYLAIILGGILVIALAVVVLVIKPFGSEDKLTIPKDSNNTPITNSFTPGKNNILKARHFKIDLPKSVSSVKVRESIIGSSYFFVSDINDYSIDRNPFDPVNDLDSYKKPIKIKTADIAKISTYKNNSGGLTGEAIIVKNQWAFFVRASSSDKYNKSINEFIKLLKSFRSVRES